MLEASDICDDIIEESIDEESIGIDEDISIGAEDDIMDESIGIDDDIVELSIGADDDMSIIDEDDWAKALDVSTTARAVPAMSRRIISSLHVGCPAGGFEAITSRAPRRSEISTQFGRMTMQ